MANIGNGNGKRRRTFAQYFDYPLMAAVVLLLAFGLVMLCSASYYAGRLENDYMGYFRRQLIYAVLVVVLMIILPIISYRRLFGLSWVIYVLALGAMAAVQLPGFGVVSHGARRWLHLGPIRFQPAELGKVAVIVFLPMVILKLGKRMWKFRSVLLLLLVVGVQAGACRLLTDNLSTALIILFIGYVIIFVAYPRTKQFVLVSLGVGAALAVCVPVVLKLMEGGFRLTRVRVWLDPAANLSDGGWQVMQALYAIGSGGLLGKGLGNSTQKLGWIPEAQNDMIFAIVCEELGIFGALILLGLFVYIIFRLVFIAQNAPDVYGSLMVTGITAHIAIQVILNICVVLNMIPTTGVTLPLVSYGGTALLIQGFEICIALSVSRRIAFAEAEIGPSGRKWREYRAAREETGT